MTLERCDIIPKYALSRAKCAEVSGIFGIFPLAIQSSMYRRTVRAHGRAGSLDHVPPHARYKHAFKRSRSPNLRGRPLRDLRIGSGDSDSNATKSDSTKAARFGSIVGNLPGGISHFRFVGKKSSTRYCSGGRSARRRVNK